MSGLKRRHCSRRIAEIGLLLTLTAATAAYANPGQIDFECTASPIDDWPAQLDIRDDRVLCRATEFDVRIEVTGINQRRSAMTGDGSHIVEMFRRHSASGENAQPVTMHVEEFSPNVLEYFLRDGRGQRITQLHRQFVWTRDFTPGQPHRQRDTIVVYGATQSLRCSHLEVDGQPGPPLRCIAARTVVVCDSFHDIQPGLRGQVSYPVLTAQSFGEDASIAMLNGFESVAQVLEDIQTEILSHTCGEN